MTSAPRQPPLRDFADRGTAWLLESPAHMRDLVAIIEAGLVEKLDFSRARPENRPQLSDDLDKRQNDILFRVPYKDGDSEVWICVLLEHQSRPDPLLGFRLLRYKVGIWGIQLREGKAGKPDIQVERAPLKRLERVLASAIEAIDDLPEEMRTERREAFHYLLLLLCHRRSAEEQERLAMIVTTAAHKHREEMDEMKKMSAIETWLLESRREGELTGELKGELRGELKGELKGKREDLLTVLQVRFGPVPQHLPPKLETLSVRDLETLLIKAVTASSLADLHLDD